MKIAIFGGGFDPLHSEHVKIIEDGLKFTDKLILVPSFNPPHKETNDCSFEQRVGMLNTFAYAYPNIIVDLIEKDIGLENSYTYKILPKIKQKYGQNDYFFLLGGDSLVNFETWKNPKDIINEVTLVAYQRKPYDTLLKSIEKLKQSFNAKILIRDLVGENVSSSEIRASLMLKLNQNNKIPDAVYQYILDNNLYNKFDDIVNKLKSLQSQALFEHSIRTTLFAIKLNAKLGLEFDKVFLASLLHDAAKETKPQKSYQDVDIKVVHQYEGRLLANQIFGINDTEILEAIEYHTTGKPNMSKLGMLVYAADKLEPCRNYDSIDRIREEIFTDFDNGFRQLVAKNTEIISAKKGYLVRPFYN